MGVAGVVQERKQEVVVEGYSRVGSSRENLSIDRVAKACMWQFLNFSFQPPPSPCSCVVFSTPFQHSCMWSTEPDWIVVHSHLVTCQIVISFVGLIVHECFV